MSRGRIFNGVDAKTGRYLRAPETEEEFVRLIRDEPLTPKQLRDYKWWIERYAINDPKRAPAVDVDPQELDSSGWGVIFAPSTSSEVEKALQPLLAHRAKTAGTNFRNYRLSSKQLENKDAFLTAAKAGQGPANPKNGKPPYYLLIVGSPKEISFEFQYDLDIQYAVGRIHFTDKDGNDDIEAYKAYALNVVETEEAAKGGSAALPPKQIALFGVSQQGDLATERAEKELIQQLAKTLAEDRPDWPLKVLVGLQANKAQLSRLFGRGETPSLLLTTSHGMRFPFKDDLQLSSQGALLCENWPGDDRPVPPKYYFSAADLSDEADLRGLISVNFACYGAGTPDFSSFLDEPMSKPQPMAPTPFVSKLAQRLLGHPRGALAVVGHVDRAWSMSFSWTGTGQADLYENTFKRLIDGYTIGYAMEFFNQRHAELAVYFTEIFKDRERLKEGVDDETFARAFRASSDVRNFVVLGDPAVRAAFRMEDKKSES